MFFYSESENLVDPTQQNVPVEAFYLEETNAGPLLSEEGLYIIFD